MAALQQGGVIAYPTEAVWGLGCDPYNSAAVTKLCQLKQRPLSKGVLLVGADVEQVAPLLQSLPPARRAAIMASWPGHVTWVLPNTLGFGDYITGGRNTVAVRISAHPVIQQLSSQFGGLIVSTSANLSGQEPAKSQLDVSRVFGATLDYIVAGDDCPSEALPSKIYEATTGRQLR